MFTIYSDSGSDSTIVSNLFIDEYMKSANDAQIKVYLYLLRVMGTHRPASVSDMADQFNHTEKDVLRSLRYWEKMGLLDLTFENENDLVSIRLCHPSAADRRSLPGAQDAAQMSSLCLPGAQTASAGLTGAQAVPAGRVLSFSSSAGNLQADLAGEQASLRMASGGSLPVQGSSCAASAAAAPAAPKKSCSEQEALQSFSQDADRARLLFVIEQYIGKPLSLNEIRIIYNISENLHFSDDMIDYLLQYCVDRGRKDFRYIQKMAENWSREGIMTPAQAEANAFASEKKAPAGRSASADPSGTGDLQGAAGQGEGSGGARGRTKGRPAARPRSSNSFNQFEQNSYDFDALEKELLRS